MTLYYVPVILILHADTERGADAHALLALDSMQYVEGYILHDDLKNSPASAAWHDMGQILRDGRIIETRGE